MKSTKCILKLNKKDNHLYLQLPKSVKENGFLDGEPLHLWRSNNSREFEVMGSMDDEELHLKGKLIKLNQRK